MMEGMSESPSSPRASRNGTLAVVAVAFLLSTAVAVFVSPEQQTLWYLLALAGCLIASFAVQVALGQARGFIVRVAVAMASSLAVIGLVALVAAVITALASGQ